MKKSKPFLLGITGSLGTGKSLVGNILKEEGVPVVDTDDIVRKVLNTKNNITKRIVYEFGKIILSKDKEYIDKKALSDVVFKDNCKRKKLESIVHPEVRKTLSKLIKLSANKKVIAVLIPLLFESKMEKHYDEVWCVICNKIVQLKRLKKKGYKSKEAIARIKAQLPQNEKAKRSDYVINNSGSLIKTRKQVLSRFKMLVRLNRNHCLSFYK